MTEQGRLLAVEAGLRSLFPATVSAAVEPIALAAPDDLWPEERAAIAAAVPGRQAEFAAGRRAARRALAVLGLPVQALPMGRDRAPVWPPGSFGSISHAGGVAVAVASLSGPLGVDIEPAKAIDPALWTVICTEAERARLPLPEAGHAVCRLFAAKEAVFKAQPPAARAMFGFDTLDVTLAGAGFVAHFTTAAGVFPAGAQVAGRLALAGGLVLAGVSLCG